MAEFLCDTMRDGSYDEPDPHYGIGAVDRRWFDIPNRPYSGNDALGFGTNYIIPIPSRIGPLGPHMRDRINHIGVGALGREIGILTRLGYTDSELRALLETYDYVHGNREPWWQEGRYDG